MTTVLSDLLQTLTFKRSPQKSSPIEPQPMPLPPIQSELDCLPSGLPIYTLADVAHHDDFNDCWIVIYDRVYDVTNFLHSHPGGEDVIMDHAGRDATLAFHGTGHTKGAIKQMSDYLIGELPPKERIFRTAHACKVLSLGIPHELE